MFAIGWHRKVVWWSLVSLKHNDDVKLYAFFLNSFPSSIDIKIYRTRPNKHPLQNLASTTSSYYVSPLKVCTSCEVYDTVHVKVGAKHLGFFGAVNFDDL